MLTGVTGFLISYGMLQLGVQHMWIRYPVATLVSYGVLLALIRGWVAIEDWRFDPVAAGLAKRLPPDRELSLHYQPTKHSWWDGFDIPDLGFIDGDDGCLPLLLLLALVGLVATIFMMVAAAPALIAEVFLDAFIVTALYRRLRAAQKEHWLGTALRKTWGAALAMATALGLAGWVLEEIASGAPSIGKAIEQLRDQPLPP